MDEHRCNDCGLFAQQNIAGDVVEAFRSYRDKPSEFLNDRRFLPLCTLYIRDFKKDFEAKIAELDSSPEPTEGNGVAGLSRSARSSYAMEFVISSPYKCDHWDPYIPGTPPKEHWDRRNRERVFEREERRDALAAERHREQMDALKGQHRRELFVFGGVIAVATVVGALIQASWIRQPGWWP